MHQKEIIENKTIYVKIALLLLTLNTLILGPGIVLIDLRPDWSIYPAEERSRRAIMLALFYILFVFAVSGVVYAHAFVCIYLGVYIKIEMELLTQYFQDVSSKCRTGKINGDLKNVYGLLVKGIELHTKLLRYAFLFKVS